MDNPSLIGLLAIVTLVIVLAVAAHQMMKTRQSQAKRGEKPVGTDKFTGG